MSLRGRLGRWREIAAKATPGPWVDRHVAVFDGDPLEGARQIAYCGTAMSNREVNVIEQDQINNAFIAAFDPVVVTALLDVVEAAEAERQAYENRNSLWREWHEAMMTKHAALDRLAALEVTHERD